MHILSTFDRLLKLLQLTLTNPSLIYRPTLFIPPPPPLWYLVPWTLIFDYGFEACNISLLANSGSIILTFQNDLYKL